MYHLQGSPSRLTSTSYARTVLNRPTLQAVKAWHVTWSTVHPVYCSNCGRTSDNELFRIKFRSGEISNGSDTEITSWTGNQNSLSSELELTYILNTMDLRIWHVMESIIKRVHDEWLNRPTVRRKVWRDAWQTVGRFSTVRVLSPADRRTGSLPRGTRL